MYMIGDMIYYLCMLLNEYAITLIVWQTALTLNMWQLWVASKYVWDLPLNFQQTFSTSICIQNLTYNKVKPYGTTFCWKVVLYLVAATDFHRWNTLTDCMIIHESVFKLVWSDNYSIAVFTVVARWAQYIYTKTSAKATIQHCVKPRRTKNLLYCGGRLKSHNYSLLYAKCTTAESY